MELWICLKRCFSIYFFQYLKNNSSKSPLYDKWREMRKQMSVDYIFDSYFYFKILIWILIINSGESVFINSTVKIPTSVTVARSSIPVWNLQENGNICSILYCYPHLKDYLLNFGYFTLISEALAWNITEHVSKWCCSGKLWTSIFTLLTKMSVRLFSQLSLRK